MLFCASAAGMAMHSCGCLLSWSCLYVQLVNTVNHFIELLDNVDGMEVESADPVAPLNAALVTIEQASNAFLETGKQRLT
jgi:hypothetical protein